MTMMSHNHIDVIHFHDCFLLSYCKCIGLQKNHVDTSLVVRGSGFERVEFVVRVQFKVTFRLVVCVCFVSYANFCK